MFYFTISTLVAVFLCAFFIDPVCGLRIFHISLKDDKNIGDVYSSPLRYFSDLESVTTEVICVDANTPEVVNACADLRKEDITIIGGGGLLDHSDRWNFAIKYYCQRTTCILWSPGRNRHHSHATLSFTHTTEQILAAAAAGRTRDFHNRDEPEPLLDPSCLLPGLLSDSSSSSTSFCEKTRGVGYYLHAKLSQLRRVEVEHLLHGVESEDVLYNDELNITTVLQFLCRHEVIVTSSYHGVLWATFMNIPVYSVFDFSEKFNNLPFTVRKYPIDKENAPSLLSSALYVNGIFLKNQCIQDNLEFYTTYVEPFVTILKTLAYSPSPVVSNSGWLSITDFDLRGVVTTVGAECSPLHRNHVYEKLDAPKYEANLYVEMDVTFAIFLLQIHDTETNGTTYSEAKPRLFVMLQSGSDAEPFSMIDFTDYIIHTVSTIRDIRDKPSYEYTSNQFHSSVRLVLGLLQLDAHVEYKAKLVAVSDEEVEGIRAGTLAEDTHASLLDPSNTLVLISCSDIE